MSTFVQELGRLCRYSEKDTPNAKLPYALVSQKLHNQVVRNTATPLLDILRSYPERLDSHMKLENRAKWDRHKDSCSSVQELLTLMRGCFKAADGNVDKTLDKGTKRVVMYDAGRRKDATNEELMQRYHHRRLMLDAEPQIGKTGAFLGLIEVCACYFCVALSPARCRSCVNDLHPHRLR